jgi:hypothetical protein
MFNGDIVYALDLGREENQLLTTMYSTRRFFLWEKNLSVLRIFNAYE